MTFRQFLAEATETWYHGSDSAIEKFEYTDKQDAVHQEGPGIYLTSSRKDARRYGKHVHVVEAKIVKSRMMPERKAFRPELVRFLISKSPDRDDALTDWDEDPAKAMRKAVEAIMDRHGPNEFREAMETIWFDFYRGHERAWLERMTAAGMGWDGFILDRAEGVRHFICFNPKILKMVDRELIESLNQSYPFKLNRHSDGDYSAVFYVDDKKDLDNTVAVNFVYDEDADAYMIQFDRGGRFGMTGGGSAQRIMATVLRATERFMSDENPTAVGFSSKEDSRTSLYARLVRKMAPRFGLVDVSTSEPEARLKRWAEVNRPSHGAHFMLVTKDRTAK